MIEHHLDQNEFAYFDEQGKKVGRLLYHEVHGNVIDAFHTKIDEAYQGKGIAGELYQALIDFAKQHQLKIQPSCSYIAIKMQRSDPDLIA